MTNPKVSVLLPVYNGAATLEATLESLLEQTLTDFEIIVVDDGSVDESAACMQNWSERSSSIRPFYENHAGLIPALNRGLRECRGIFVARMDADDIAHPLRLQRQLEAFETDSSLSVIGTLVETFPREMVGDGMLIYESWQNQLISHEQIVREIFVESPIAHPSAMMRRSELVEMGGYHDFGWPEDYDLWLRYYTSGKRFGKVPEVLLSWREHPLRQTHLNSWYSVENFLRVKAHYLMRGPLLGRTRTIVWGAGKTGRRLSKHLLREGCRLEAFVDIAEDKIGKSLRGVPIVSVEDLPELLNRDERAVVLAAVASRGARSLIREQLDRLRLIEGADYWCVA